MQVSGDQLRKILEQQEHEVAVCDSRSFSRGNVLPKALKLISPATYVQPGRTVRNHDVRVQQDTTRRAH